MKPYVKLFLVAIAAMAILLPAQAAVSVVDVGITNSIAANTTTTANLGNAVLVDNHDKVSAVLAFQGNASGTGNITLKLGRSADGTTYETVGFTNYVAANGTTAVVAWFDIPETTLGSAKYLKVLSIANADASLTGTNASLKIVLKKVR